MFQSSSKEVQITSNRPGVLFASISSATDFDLSRGTRSPLSRWAPGSKSPRTNSPLSDGNSCHLRRTRHSWYGCCSPEFLELNGFDRERPSSGIRWRDRKVSTPRTSRARLVFVPSFWIASSFLVARAQEPNEIYPAPAKHTIPTPSAECAPCVGRVPAYETTSRDQILPPPKGNRFPRPDSSVLFADSR